MSDGMESFAVAQWLRARAKLLVEAANALDEISLPSSNHWETISPQEINAVESLLLREKRKMRPEAIARRLGASRGRIIRILRGSEKFHATSNGWWLVKDKED